MNKKRRRKKLKGRSVNFDGYAFLVHMLLKQRSDIC